MDCREAVYSNDYYDFISEYKYVHGVAGEIACVQPLNDRYEIVFTRREKGLRLNFADYNFYSLPTCLGPLDLPQLEDSGISRAQTLPTLSLKGKGILLGFLDSGIDYENRSFRDEDGRSRIEAIWDQTVEYGVPPDGFVYGHEYTGETINRALSLNNPQQLVPTGDMTGHGTFITSVAAGSVDRISGFSGAAPLSRIAVVKLKQAKKYIRDFLFIKEDAQAYQISDAMAAVEYLNRMAAQLNMPLVICFGLGSNYGSHTGRGPLDQMLNQIALQNRRAVVIAAGNEANRRLHYSGINFETGKDEWVEIQVGEAVRGFTAEIWAKTPDLYSIEIISPTGERIPRRPPRIGTSTEYIFVFENTRVTVEYRISDITSGGELIFIRFDNPTKGIWSIRVFGDVVLWGQFNIWLTFSGFLSGDVFFIRSNPDTTLTTPSPTESPITVGAYDSYNNSIFLPSGRGFPPNGAIKPDFAAPGVDIIGAGLNDTLVVKSGTSVAAALTSGAVALLFEWETLRGSSQFISSVVLKNLLIHGTSTDSARAYPNREWGYGKLNLFEAFNQYRIT